jgi:putative ABC transport system ATP-binding protein
MLKVKSVCKRFGNQQVLDAMEFTIQRGTITAVLGRSGSGKSTLFNLIAGLDRVDSGEITIDQTPITRLGETDRTIFRREQIGFIYQSFNLIPTLTVEENVRLPVELKGGSKSSALSACGSILEKVSLGERARAFPHDLSSGEQQRVAIARALVHAPALVLADEPTGNLDSETGAQVLSLFKDLVVQQGATLLIATHSKIVANSADEVLVIDNGKIIRTQSDLAW